MITLTMAGFDASTTALISSFTNVQFWSLIAPTLITMSTSSAPAFTASEASNAFAEVSIAPRGKPTTQHTFTSLPFNSDAMSGTWQLFTHTDAKPYSRASLQ